jgi:hypothetical protein
VRTAIFEGEYSAARTKDENLDLAQLRHGSTLVKERVSRAAIDSQAARDPR